MSVLSVCGRRITELEKRIAELEAKPDASAGLIEAAEMAEQCANGSFSKNEAMYLRGFADRLHARAADRSDKRRRW